MPPVALHYPRSLHFTPQRRRASQALARALFGPPTGSAAGVLPQRGIHRILVCHVSHTLGNSLLLTPLLQELERIYPGAEIDIVSRNPVAPALYRGYPGVARVGVLPAYGARHPLRVLEVWRSLRAHRYDLAIDTDPQSQTGRLMVLWSRARHSLGYAGPRKSGQITHTVPLAQAPARKALQGVFLLRQALGFAPLPQRLPRPDIRLDETERRRGRLTLARLLPASLPSRRKTLGVFANATGRKRLDEAWWQALLDRLQPLQAHYDVIEILPASGQSLLGDRYPGYFCSDVRKLAGLLSALDACVIGDCGVMHLAAAAGTPLAALFVDTDPAQWGPYGTSDRVLQVRRDQPQATAQELLEFLLPHAGAAPGSGPVPLSPRSASA